MEKTYRVGVAGLTHGHVWGLMESFRKAPGTQMVAVADATPLLDRAEGFVSKYTDWREMLEKEQIDVLVVTSNNVESSEIAVAALEKGIPCVVEKAMAANAADADRMLAASKKSGALLMVNWPLAWSRGYREAVRLAAEGAIGEPFYLRYRNGHNGPKEIGCDEWFVGWLYDEKLNGGGSIADFGSYGAAVARTVLGMPESVFCFRGNLTKDYDVCDDHAVILLNYPHAHAYLESTWATKGSDASANPVISGREGTIAVVGDKVSVSKGWNDATESEAPSLTPGDPATYFFHCFETGTDPEGILNAEISADACRILDAAIRSSASGKAEVPG